MNKGSEKAVAPCFAWNQIYVENEMMIIHKLFVVCVKKHFSRTEREKEVIGIFFARTSLGLIGGLIIKFSEQMWILTTLSVGVHLFSFTILQVEICIHCYLWGEN